MANDEVMRRDEREAHLRTRRSVSVACWMSLVHLNCTWHFHLICHSQTTWRISKRNS